MSRDLAVVDLFCGIGGFSTGATRAGARVALAVDANPEALRVHHVRHPRARARAWTLGGDLDVLITRSTDGGVTWTPATGVADAAAGVEDLATGVDFLLAEGDLSAIGRRRYGQRFGIPSGRMSRG